MTYHKPCAALNVVMQESAAMHTSPASISYLRQSCFPWTTEYMYTRTQAGRPAPLPICMGLNGCILVLLEEASRELLASPCTHRQATVRPMGLHFPWLALD